MAVTVERFTEYLRVTSVDPETLEMYIAAAKDKALAAGVPEYQDNAQYDLFIYALAAMYYDNRGMAMGAGDEESARRMVNSFVLELRHSREADGEQGVNA